MDWKTLLTNEAVSNYLVFGAGLLVGLLLFLARQLNRKPSIIRLEKQQEVSLIEVGRDARDRLKVTYRNEPVQHFHVTIFKLSNKSGTLIEDISLKLYLDEEHGKQKLYEMVIDDPLEDTRKPAPTVECVIEESGQHFLLLKIPYLNDARHNRDSLTIRIFSPEPIIVSRLVGGGKGWMSQFYDRVAFNRRLEQVVGDSNSVSSLVANVLRLSLGRWFRI